MAAISDWISASVFSTGAGGAAIEEGAGGGASFSWFSASGLGADLEDFVLDLGVATI